MALGVLGCVFWSYCHCFQGAQRLIGTATNNYQHYWHHSECRCVSSIKSLILLKCFIICYVSNSTATKCPSPEGTQIKPRLSGSGLAKELTPGSKAATLETSRCSAGGWWCLQLSKRGRNSNSNIFSTTIQPSIKIEPPTNKLFLCSPVWACLKMFQGLRYREVFKRPKKLHCLRKW